MSRTKEKQNEQQTKKKTDNQKNMHWFTEHVNKRLSHDRPILASVKFKYLCDYGTDNCHDSVTRVAGKLQVPTMQSRDILHQAKGGSSWSSPLRSEGSQDDQAGEAGPVEL